MMMMMMRMVGVEHLERMMMMMMMRDGIDNWSFLSSAGMMILVGISSFDLEKKTLI